MLSRRRSHPAMFILLIVSFAVSTTQAQILYWANTGAGRIERLLPGNEVETVIDGGSPRGLAVDPIDRKLYWVDGASRTLRRANLDGSQEEGLAVNAGRGGGVALDCAGGKVYWTDVALGNVFRANLDGSGAELLGNVGLHVLDIDLDLVNGKMYLAITSNDSILRANLDYSGVETFISGTSQAFSVTVDSTAGVLYWSDGALHQSPVSNAAATVTISDADAFDIALDAATDTLYWITLDARGRIHTDGTGFESQSTTGLTAARSITVAFPTGDVECDGDLDIGDAQTLVDVLLGIETDAFKVAQADVNGDGSADGRDIGPLVLLLVGD